MLTKNLAAPYGAGAISFILSRKKRKTVAIRITREGNIEVSAPLRLSESEIIRMVAGRGAWITAQQRRLAQLPPPMPHQYVNGETWHYLGQAYVLRVLVGVTESAALVGEELRLTVREPTRAQKVLTRWLRVQAQQVFSERIAHCVAHAAQYGLHHSSEFALRAMRSRWGSMSSAGRMTLNLYLIHAPVGCIDFVILHELCHLREFNHSPAYYALLTRVLPDWKARRELLSHSVRLPERA